MLRPSAWALALVLASFPGLASAQRCVSAADRADLPTQERYCGADLITGLGGVAGFGDHLMAGNGCLHLNDDESSPPIDIRTWFPGGLRFFDSVHTSLYVNTNGNITFSGPLGTYTPSAFPVAGRPMIAPFWADVDTRGTGCMYSPAGACFPRAENQVWWHFEAATGTTPARAIFTWDEVGYFGCLVDRRHSFQLILTQANFGCAPPTTPGMMGTDFDVEFRFNRCEWDTGNASGGSGGFWVGPFGAAAQSGFDAGNTRDYVEIMGSRMTRVINRRLCEESNVTPAEPGVWRFLVREGVVMCPDAGMACTVPGEMGACADGRMNCVGSGTECIQQVVPSPERCDAIDNDCDGMADEEDSGSLCPVLSRCMGGRCVDPCFEGGCPDGESCTPTGCVETACVGVTCPATERCTAGACVPACDGIVCPRGRACLSGRCVDVCAGLTCDDCTVCEDGACVPRCALAPCPAGETCADDGHCIEDACVGVVCPAGRYCGGGSCLGPCDGVVCPDGEACVMGECVVAPVDAGPPPFDAGPRDAGPPDTGPVEMIDAGVDASRRPADRPRTCNCSTPGEGRGTAPLWALAALAAAGFVRRRRPAGAAPRSGTR
jgi:MYXO-CTERM domain-containing protein